MNATFPSSDQEDGVSISQHVKQWTFSIETDVRYLAIPRVSPVKSHLRAISCHEARHPLISTARGELSHKPLPCPELPCVPS